MHIISNLVFISEIIVPPLHYVGYLHTTNNFADEINSIHIVSAKIA